MTVHGEGFLLNHWKKLAISVSTQSAILVPTMPEFYPVMHVRTAECVFENIDLATHQCFRSKATWSVCRIDDGILIIATTEKRDDDYFFHLHEPTPKSMTRYDDTICFHVRGWNYQGPMHLDSCFLWIIPLDSAAWLLTAFNIDSWFCLMISNDTWDHFLLKLSNYSW